MPPDERRPLSDFGKDDLSLPRLSPEESQRQLRQYGTELLKRGMLENLGVDTVPRGGLYDDTPTMQEMQRRNAFGKPSVSDLEDREIQMEQQLQRPLTRDQIFPPRRETPINLQPVEHDPFSVHLVPVEHDPFQSDPYTAATPTRQDPFGIGNAIADRLALPRRVMEGVQPENPGVMDEATAYRMNQLDDQAVIWASRQAIPRR